MLQEVPKHMLRRAVTARNVFRHVAKPLLARSGVKLRPHGQHSTVPSAASPETVEQTAPPGTTTAKASRQQPKKQAQQHVATEQQQDSFNWHHVWYPVAIVSQLNERRPTAVQLLGIPMVAWKDSNDDWVVFEDRCLHRLAPLSEGRIDSSGNLMCSYHGWQFNSSGACTSIPQIDDPAARQTACNTKKSCATKYPAQVRQGLLWVWPESTSPDLAAITPPALTSQWQADGWTMLGGEWFMRDVEYGYDTLMENLFDPSHIPFAHHGIMGSASRDKALPLNISTSIDVTPQGGFQLHRNSAPFRTAAPTDTVNNFVPPVLNSSMQTNTAKGTSMMLTFYGIPTAPGKSRVITAFFTNAKVPKIAMKLVSLFEWVFHLGQNQVLDSDAMLLHVQERLLHEGKDHNWKSAFYMPAASDTGIIKFRQWYTDCAGGDIPWPGALQQQGLGQVKPREVVMDRYNQHVVHCKSCQAAIKSIQRWQAVALGLAAVAAAAAVATGTAAVVGASAAGAGSSVATTASVVGALASVPTLAVGMLAVVAVALYVGHRMLGQLMQRFFFVDYVHADRQ